MSVPRIAVTGAHGQVGWELVRALQPIGEVFALTRRDCDLHSPDHIVEVMRRIRPALIVNAGAYTAVDRAESEPELAMRINGEAPGILGDLACEFDAAVIHFSTDYVFDGHATRPYREDDAPAPLNVYGRSKLAGERALAGSGAAHIICRTSWVYAIRGRNFLRTILRLARERETLRIVADQVGVPTWARWLSDACAQMAGGLVRDPAGAAAACRAVGGLVHVTGSGQASWHQFAEAILAADPASAEHRATRIEAISSAEHGGSTLRPLFTVLDSSLAHARFGLARTHWKEQLHLAMAVDAA